MLSKVINIQITAVVVVGVMLKLTKRERDRKGNEISLSSYADTVANSHTISLAANLN